MFKEKRCFQFIYVEAFSLAGIDESEINVRENIIKKIIISKFS
jgi:hypothetical protein